MTNPTNIANANPDPPAPADRVVPIYGWRTKKTKKGTKGQKDKRGGALGSSFSGFSSCAVLVWWFDKKHTCVINRRGRAKKVLYSAVQLLAGGVQVLFFSSLTRLLIDRTGLDGKNKIKV